MLSFLRLGILSILTHWKLSIMQSLTHILIMPMSLGSNFNAVNRVPILQKKVLRTISFQWRDCHSSLLFKKQNLLKFEDKIQLGNVLLVSKYFNNISPSTFDKWFTLCSDILIITQLPPLQGNYSNCTNLYGKNSVTLSAVNARNKMQIVFRNVILRTLTTTQIKTLLTKKCIEKYWQIIHLMLTGKLC